MWKNKICSFWILTIWVTGSAFSVEYVNLELYKNSSSYKPNQGLIAAFIEDNWNTFKNSVNETIISDNLTSDNFWNTIRYSLEDGTLYNRLANYQMSGYQKGSDFFLSTVYSSIDKIPVTYKSTLPNGDSVILSGKIFLPKTKKAKHIIIANHFTICSSAEAPSNNNCIEGIYATKGYIVLMPDYIGYGISDSIIHPYLHLSSSISSALDMLKAALPYLKAQSYSYDQSLILIGYSQGAAVTLALQQTLEKDYPFEYPVHRVFAGAGPYDLAGTFDFYLDNPTTDIPCSIPMLMTGLNYGENLNLKMEDFFQPTLMEQYPVYIKSKSKTLNEVTAALGHDIMTLLKPITFFTDSFPTSVLYEAVKKNSIIQWSPVSELYLFHSTEDNMVPFLNSEHLKQSFEKQELQNIKYDFAPYGNHMEAAVTFFEKVYRML